MSVELSLSEARKLALLSQNIYSSQQWGQGVSATRKAIEHLGYIQIDTISVIERAHHHTLWNRVKGYRLSHLDSLIMNRQIFEYWSHAAAYLPMQDYRFCLPRMQQYVNGESHWFSRDKKMMDSVYARIKSEGPLQARDFESDGTKRAMWDWKPAKQALEQLFMEGKLMISHRVKFQKVFDLAERVLPSGISLEMPDSEAFSRFLIDRYLSAHGFGNATEMTYLRKGWGKVVQSQLDQMVEEGQLITFTIQSKSKSKSAAATKCHYCRRSDLEWLNKKLKRNRVKILSPFDNLVIQRKRIEYLFDFHFQLECYVPKDKRQFGYFVLPVLWGDQFVARLDIKADRQGQVLYLHNLVLEHGLKDAQAFFELLCQELRRFADMMCCNRFSISKRIDRSIGEFFHEDELINYA